MISLLVYFDGKSIWFRYLLNLFGSLDVPSVSTCTIHMLSSYEYLSLSLGTGVYAPPELLVYGMYSSAACTAWSLGILLYNMLGTYINEWHAYSTVTK